MTAHQDWRDDFVLERAERSLGGRGGIQRHLRSGQLTRVAEPLLFAMHSAAVLWQLPAIEPWPRKVHVVAGTATGGRSTAALARHTVGPVAAHELNGLLVTPLARTVVDLARSSSLRPATGPT